MNNSVTLVGRVGQAPQSRLFEDSGNLVVRFSVAVKDFGSDDDRTLWFEVESWNGVADRVIKTVTKGREVVISGRLSLVSYPKEIEGIVIEMTKPVIKLQSFHLCGSAPRKREEVLNDNQLAKIS